MASMQKSREERAEETARRAADELHAARQHDPSPAAHGGGMLGTVQESARSLLGAVRDKVSAPSSGAGGGYAADEGKGLKDAAEGAKEAARRAVAGSAPARKGETDESAWQQGEDVRRLAAEKARRRGSEHEPSMEEKGRSATENIYGSAASATEAFKQKMTMPEDVVEEKKKHGGGGERGTATAMTTGGEGGTAEEVMMRVKDADQMTGQMFNDVGMMGEEGTGDGRRRR
uniref:Uncharacterized protein n=1 Tax=Leersia perrieri TaxID=77586 RepID=A0A0D9UZL9_9ORYZ